MLKQIPVTTIALAAGAAAVAAILVLQVLRTGGLPDPTGHGDFGARILDIAVLVFREGLECILVLSAITANMMALVVGSFFLARPQARRLQAGSA